MPLFRIHNGRIDISIRAIDSHFAAGIFASEYPEEARHTVTIKEIEETNDKAKIEIYEDANNEFRFRVKASNGEVVATSESYTRREDAHRGWETLRSVMGSRITEVVRLP